jgi:L-lactate dehydrogenase complex protein LldG
VSSAREAILGRVRAALGDGGVVPEVPRAYRRAGEVPADAERFAERVSDYRAEVHRCTAAELDGVVARLLDGARVAVPPEPPCATDAFEAVADDPPLDVRALDGLDAVLTGCALAVAETGTIVLDGGPASGRRALTLVPDHHVCVVHEAQVVAGVPELVAGIPRDRPITLVSGPSATSDIELERVEGVHGPRRLDVVLVADAPA